MIFILISILVIVIMMKIMDHSGVRVVAIPPVPKTEFMAC
jgi:hypothetical protein